MDEPVPEQPAPPPLPDLPEPLEVHPPETPSPQPPTPPPPVDQPSSHSKLPLIAILVFAVLLTIAGGVWFLGQARQASAPLPTPVPTAAQQAPTAPPDSSLALSLESQQDRESTTSGEILVRGKTLPNTIVVFFTDVDEDSSVSDAAGVFQGRVTLDAGRNTLSVFAVTADGGEQSVTREVVFETTTQVEVASPSARFVHGLVTGVNESLITVLEQGLVEKYTIIAATSSSVIKARGSETSDLSQLELGQRIAAVGKEEADGTIIAKLIHIISGTP